MGKTYSYRLCACNTLVCKLEQLQTGAALLLQFLKDIMESCGQGHVFGGGGWVYREGHHHHFLQPHCLTLRIILDRFTFSSSSCL